MANKGLLSVAFSPHLQLTQGCLFSSSGRGCLDGSQCGELLSPPKEPVIVWYAWIIFPHSLSVLSHFTDIAHDH